MASELLKDKKYRLYASIGYDKAGKRLPRPNKVFYGTARQAEEAEVAFRDEVKRNRNNKVEEIVLQDFLKNWLTTHIRDYSYNTFKGMRQYFERYVYDTSVGCMPLRKLITEDFYELYENMMVERGLSSTTTGNLHRYLHTALKAAMEHKEKYGLQYHPMAGVKTPKKAETLINRLKPHEVETVLNSALKNKHFGFFVYLSLAFAGGFRRGEQLALTWEDITILPDGILRIKISKQLVKIEQQDLGKIKQYKLIPNTTLALKPPKNGKTRYIYLSKELGVLLQDYKAQSGDIWGKHDLIFPNTIQGYILPDELTHELAEFIADYKLPKVTVHGLRHTCACLMINDGRSLEEVSLHLGHSTTQITQTTYVEIWEETKMRGAENSSFHLPTYKKESAPTANGRLIQFPRKAVM